MRNSLLRVLLFFLAISFFANPSSAQKKGKKKVVPVAKTEKPVKNSQSSPVIKKRVFEGALRYVVYTYASKAAQKYSHSQVFPGTSIVTKFVSGNKIHIYNESSFQHTIIDLDNDKYCVYSDLTKEGYVYKWSDFEKSAYGLEYKLGSVGWKGKENVSYKKASLFRSNCSYTSQSTTYSGESWWSDELLLSPIMAYLQGDCVKGIECRKLWETNAQINVGTVRTVQAQELVEIYEYKVNETEFSIPSDVTILASKKYAYAPLLNMGIVINDFNKHHEKALKKLHIIDTTSREEAISQIQQEWKEVSNMAKSETKSRSVFSLVVEEYGAANLGNDISSALTQTASAFESTSHQGVIQNDIAERPGEDDTRTAKKNTTNRKTSLRNFVNTSTDDRCYGNYESQLIGCKYGGYPACDPRDRKQIQSKMKEIRERMEKQGLWKRGKSEWEDWDGK